MGQPPLLGGTSWKQTQRQLNHEGREDGEIRLSQGYPFQPDPILNQTYTRAHVRLGKKENFLGRANQRLDSNKH